LYRLEGSATCEPSATLGEAVLERHSRFKLYEAQKGSSDFQSSPPKTKT
jgi:hypothetical protein